MRDTAWTIKTLNLPTQRAIPALGQGTYGMGEDRANRRAEVAALRLGLDIGMCLVDTAEMYGDGGAEEVVGEAIAGRREEVFLTSKVLPQNAGREATVEACERSLRRLKTEYLDLYLLHWREDSVPLAKTLEAFQALQRAHKIRDYGVSNFDQDEMEEARELEGGDEIATNQVLYNLSHRGIEFDLLPWCRMRGLPVMAYSPLEEGDLVSGPKLKPIAERHDATPAQVALAWLLGQEGVIVFPKAAKEAHVRENRAALDLKLDDRDLKKLDRAFRPPRQKVTLQTR